MSRTPILRIPAALLAALVVAPALLTLPPPARGAVGDPGAGGELTYLALQSDTDDPIGNGLSAVLEPPRALFSVTGDSTTVEASVVDPALGPFRMTFRAPDGEPLAAGRYRDASSDPGPDRPGLDVSSAVDCRTGSGSFEILEFEILPDRLRLAVDFEFRCDHRSPRFQAHLRIAATVGPPAPATGRLMASLAGSGPVGTPEISVYAESDTERMDGGNTPVRRRLGQSTAGFELLPGTYLVHAADRHPDAELIPMWAGGAPTLRPDLATRFTVEAGSERPVVVILDRRHFQDIDSTTFRNDIVWLQATGITLGCGRGRYCPDDPVTRGEMAAFLVRALELPPAGEPIEFADTIGSGFRADIERLAAAGITRGCGPARFCPDDPVTRGQMAAFLVRAMGYTDRGDAQFSDDDTSEFETDIERLAAARVTRGCNPPANTRFCPELAVTRGEMAAFLHRALGGGVRHLGSMPHR